MSPAAALSVVVFPDPFGPSRASDSPRRTSRWRSVDGHLRAERACGSRGTQSRPAVLSTAPLARARRPTRRPCPRARATGPGPAAWPNAAGVRAAAPAAGAGGLASGLRILDRDGRQDGKRGLGGAARAVAASALREQIGRGQVAAHVIEHARQAVGAVRAAVAVEVRVRGCPTSSCRVTTVSVRRPTSISGERFATNELPSNRTFAQESYSTIAMSDSAMTLPPEDVRGSTLRGRSRGRCRRSGCLRP